MFTEALKGKVFDVVADTAHELGVRAFVIGGYVRDFFLQRPCNDIDIVVEGSGIALAEAVAHKLHTKVTVFKRFGTAMLRSGGIELEFVGLLLERGDAQTAAAFAREHPLAWVDRWADAVKANAHCGFYAAVAAAALALFQEVAPG